MATDPEFVSVPVAPAQQGPVIKAEQADPTRWTASTPAANGKLRAATVFLVGPWIGAEVDLDVESQILHLTQDGERIALSLPWTR